MKTIKNLTADQIRKSILQLAIQGKLVKQDPNDEPAGELVKRIYEEKHKLIKEGKIKKDKNESYIYKGDDNCYYEKVGKNKVIKLENLPFEIPDNWSWIRLSSFCDIYTGDSIKESDKNKLYRNRPEGYDYIGTKDVNFNHTIVYENGVKIPYDTQFKICPKSKILLCIEGGSAGRKIAFTSKDVCFGNKLACFNSCIVNDRYLYLFLQSPLFLQLFKDKLTGIISGVSINNLKQLFLPLPPLEEQERIVEKFKFCEPLLSRYEFIEQNITLLETSLEEKLKASILQYAIEGKLVKQNPNDEPASVLLERIKAEKEKLISEGKIKRDKNDSIIEQSDDKNYYEKNIPTGWALAKIGQLGTLTRGSGIKRTDIVENGYPCIRYGELYTTYKIAFSSAISHTTLEIYRNAYKTNENDILMTLTGENKKDISMALAYLGKDQIAYGGDMTCLSNHNMNPLYLVYAINSPYGRYCMQQLSTGDIIVHMSNDRLNKIYLPIPPLNEQKKIVIKVNQIFSLID